MTEVYTTMSHARTKVNVLLRVVIVLGASETDNCSLSNGDLSQAVDLEVIKQRSNVPSETTGTRDNFRSDLLIRDACCVHRIS